MRRRQFFGACAGAAAATAVTTFPSAAFAGVEPASLPPFTLSVMLWTVYRDLPFEQRLEKVAEAGYTSIELVNEYKNWSKEDFARMRAKMRQLGITVDATSGIDSSLCDSQQRDAFLKEVRAKLPVLEQLECSKLIILSGDKVADKSHEALHGS